MLIVVRKVLMTSLEQLKGNSAPGDSTRRKQQQDDFEKQLVPRGVLLGKSDRNPPEEPN